MRKASGTCGSLLLPQRKRSRGAGPPHACHIGALL